MAGRPSTFTQKKADAVCQRLAGGESLRAICATDGMPPESTVRQWVIDDTKGFSAQYARARDAGLDVLAEEVLAIADDGSADMGERTNEKGHTYTVVDAEHIARSRLRFDARRWYLSKLAPKRYGERIEQQITGAAGGPIVVNWRILPVKTGDGS